MGQKVWDDHYQQKSLRIRWYGIFMKNLVEKNSENWARAGQNFIQGHIWPTGRPWASLLKNQLSKLSGKQIQSNSINSRARKRLGIPGLEIQYVFSCLLLNKIKADVFD